MYRQSVETSIISARLAAEFLNPEGGGLLVLTGALAALKGTPGMIGYGLAKSAVINLVSSLAACPESGLPAKSVVTAILPITLDTPANRSAMPKADLSAWTPCQELALKLLEWSKDVTLVKNGTLYKVETKANKTQFIPHHQ